MLEEIAVEVCWPLLGSHSICASSFYLADHNPPSGSCHRYLFGVRLTFTTKSTRVYQATAVFAASRNTLERLRKRGAQLVGEVVQYKEAYRLCYIRGPEGLLIGLAQELN